jgi:hypothetical protein
MIKEYQFYSLPKKWKYMFVMQNPKEDEKELQKVLKRKTWKGRIGAYRKSFKHWIENKPKFFNGFLKVINKKSKKQFFKKFYITDYYKKDKSKWEKNKIKRKKESQDMEEILENEIFHCKPNLIFLFGGMAWGWLKKNYELHGGHDSNKKAIRDAHGTLFWFRLPKEKRKIYLIPLIHFSGTAYNSIPEESYFDHLKREWKKYKRIYS